MKAHSRRTRIFGFFAPIIGCCVACAAQEQSAAELIRSLTRLSDLEAMGVINNPCGQLMTERRSAMALAALGDAALPDLEKVLDATDARQGTSFGLPWLEMAYARIKGRAAYERLRGLELDSKVGADGPFGEDSGRRELDSAVALSLGLTLGPDAKAALDMLTNKTWNEMRTQLSQSTSLRDFAVGYSFDVVGAWSEPVETLGYKSFHESPATAAIETHFKTRSGAGCGTYNVRFLLTPIEGVSGSTTSSTTPISAT